MNVCKIYSVFYDFWLFKRVHDKMMIVAQPKSWHFKQKENTTVLISLDFLWAFIIKKY